MPRRPAQKRLAEARRRMYRDLVFESAEHVFADRGFDDATMQEIAGEAGISLKTLYAHFPGKVELYDEIIECRSREFAEAVSVAYEAEGSALDRLAVGVSHYVDFLVNHQDFLRIHLRTGRAWALRPTGTGAEDYDQGLAGFTTLIQQGVMEGVFHEEDPERMAMMGIAVMQVPLARLVTDGGAPEGQAIATIVDETLTALRRLFCKPRVLASLEAA